MKQFVRWWLPTIVVLGGILAMAIGGNEDSLEGGGAIVGAGLAIALFNVLLRMGWNDRDRDEEDAARAYFDAHGRWPDE